MAGKRFLISYVEKTSFQTVSQTKKVKKKFECEWTMKERIFHKKRLRTLQLKM